LAGRIGAINILGPDSSASQHARDKLLIANEEFYRGCDWSLDIRDAECDSLMITGIPVHLIRRDPATQCVVTRAKAEKGGWKELDLSDCAFGYIIDQMLKGPDSAQVLVAPKRSRHFRASLKAIQLS